MRKINVSYLKISKYSRFSVNRNAKAEKQLLISIADDKTDIHKYSILWIYRKKLK